MSDQLMKGFSSFKTLVDAQLQTVTTGTGGGPFQPGEIVIWRGGTGRAQLALAKWVQLDGSGCSRGEVLVPDLSQTGDSRVKESAVGDSGTIPVGVAAASIASNAFGFAIIEGYCEQLDCSKSVASGEYLQISASTAAKATPIKASVYNAGTMGSSSMFSVFAIARASFATGVGSVRLLGCFG